MLRHRLATQLGTSTLLLLAAAGACSEPTEPSTSNPPSPPASPGSAAPDRERGTVLARDDARGVPTLWVAEPAAADAHAYLAGGVGPERAAREHLEGVLALHRASPLALEAARLVRVHDVGRGGLLAVFRQSLGGLEVFRGDVKVLLRRDLELVAIGGHLHPAARAGDPAPAFAHTPEEAVVAALLHVHGVSPRTSELRASGTDGGGYLRFDLAAAPSRLAFGRPARVKKVLLADGDRLAPGYHVEVIASVEGAEELTRGIVIDATRLDVLQEDDLTQRESFDYRVWARADGTPAMPTADFTPHPTGVPDGIFPPYVATRLMSQEGFNTNPGGLADPWLADGATESRGNNVDAYTDDGVDGFTAGDLRASVSSPGAFDRAFDPTLDPQGSDAQRMAAVTQLFYTNNWLHDDWYDAGFDEAAGNAQLSNFGRGGAQGDPLLAQAQDDAPNSLNNANMLTPADGASPRMQMYLWSGRNRSLLELGPLGEVAMGLAAFGPTSFDETALGVATDDGTAPVGDGCTPPTSDVSGRFLVVDRGNCTFRLKAVNAETAGAVGILIIDNVDAANPPFMGSGDPPTPVTIPVVSVTRAVGLALRAALESGPVDVHAERESAPFADSDLDVDVVAHEWGHYLHHRLTVCNNSICGGQSEGWADFLALHTSTEEGDDLAGTFGMGSYAASARRDAAYFGIRRFPYTRDLARNGLTFRHIADSSGLPAGPVQTNGVANSEVHNTGEVWSAMLWQAYSNLLLEATGPTPPYGFAEARRRMAEYVVAGMSLAPTNPDFTEQRDALLLAALAADPTDADLLAEGFAARGAGSCAVSPAKTSPGNEGVVESFDITSRLEVVGWDLAEGADNCDGDGYLDAGESGRVEVTVRNGGWGSMGGATATVTEGGGLLLFPGGAQVAIPDVPRFATATVALDVELADAVTGATPADLQIVLGDPAGCVPTTLISADRFVEADEAPAFGDTVEARSTTWSSTGTPGLWARQPDPDGGTVWHGVDATVVTDGHLVSAPIAVLVGTPLTLSFTHRHDFEASGGTNWDAGVIEVSRDGGATWQDLGTFAPVGYGGTVGGSSPLVGRPAYVARNPSYPGRDTVTVALGLAFAGETIRVRFRVATDGSVGGLGWDVDDVTVSGVATGPFVGLVDDTSDCGAGGGGGGGGGGSGATSAATTSATTTATASSSTTGGGGEGGSTSASTTATGAGGAGGDGGAPATTTTGGGGEGGGQGGASTGIGGQGGSGEGGATTGTGTATGTATGAATGTGTGTATGTGTGTGTGAEPDGLLEASGGGCSCEAAGSATSRIPIPWVAALTLLAVRRLRRLPGRPKRPDLC